MHVFIFRTVISSIRSKVDEVYRRLHGLCAILQGKAESTHNANPHNLLISESNELLDGLKKLLDESDDIERVPFMTIAPDNWGRNHLTTNHLNFSFIRFNSSGVTRIFGWGGGAQPRSFFYLN